MEYDSITEVKMYPNKIENDLLISLDMKLGYVDEKPILEKKIGKSRSKTVNDFHKKIQFKNRLLNIHINLYHDMQKKSYACCRG